MLHGHLKFKMSKMDLMLSPQSLTFLVTSTTILPVLKRRKLGVIPCFCDSFHSFSSSHLQILPFQPKNISHIYPLLSISTCYHIFIISFFHTTKISLLDAAISSYLAYFHTCHLAIHFSIQR